MGSMDLYTLNPMIRTCKGTLKGTLQQFAISTQVPRSALNLAGHRDHGYCLRTAVGSITSTESCFAYLHKTVNVLNMDLSLKGVTAHVFGNNAEKTQVVHQRFCCSRTSFRRRCRCNLSAMKSDLPSMRYPKLANVCMGASCSCLKLTKVG